MDLREFINKYRDEYAQKYPHADFEKAITPLLAAFCERSIRTTEKWYTNTPRPVKWVLARIDREWEKTGLNLGIFFEF